MNIPIVRNILEANEQTADELRGLFAARRVLVLNLMSSPGAGKTTLLEKTLSDLGHEFGMAVIEGDLQTANDAARVAATGAQAVQINTDGGCHLNSAMVKSALENLNMERVDILFIENVGNLVCPAEFDLGEDHKITLLSVAEGDDKPEKYPYMFSHSSAVLLNKIDLLPYVDFDMDRARGFCRSLNPKAEIFDISCREKRGLDLWYDWLRAARKAKSAQS